MRTDHRRNYKAIEWGYFIDVSLINWIGVNKSDCERYIFVDRILKKSSELLFTPRFLYNMAMQSNY